MANIGIDPKRTPLNYALHGRSTAQDVFYRWNGFYNDETVFDSKPKRKDAVWLIEIIISVSAYDELAKNPAILGQYFTDTCNWVKSHFGDATLISFDVHLDEDNPHAHALILPVMNGKMCGSEINNPHNQARLRKLFAKEVGAKYGYKSDREHISKTDKDKMYVEVINVLTHNPTYMNITASPIWNAIRDSIRADPFKYFSGLGLTLKSNDSTKGRHFVDIARSKGKGTHKK